MLWTARVAPAVPLYLKNPRLCLRLPPYGSCWVLQEHETCKAHNRSRHGMGAVDQLQLCASGCPAVIGVAGSVTHPIRLFGRDIPRPTSRLLLGVGPPLKAWPRRHWSDVDQGIPRPTPLGRTECGVLSNAFQLRSLHASCLMCLRCVYRMRPRGLEGRIHDYVDINCVLFLVICDNVTVRKSSDTAHSVLAVSSNDMRRSKE